MLLRRLLMLRMDVALLEALISRRRGHMSPVSLVVRPCQSGEKVHMQRLHKCIRRLDTHELEHTS